MGGGLTLSGNPNTTLTLASGGVIVNAPAGKTETLSVPPIALGAVEGQFHVNTGVTLNVFSAITNTSTTTGLTKADGGSLVFEVPQYYAGTTYLNQGSITLPSGFTNPLLADNPLDVTNGSLNGVSPVTLNLNGSNQYIGQLGPNNSGATPVNQVALANTTITSVAPASFVTNNNATASSTFGGAITGALSFAKGGTDNLTLVNNNTYTGATTVNGGILVLQDFGTLANTSSLEIDFGTLQINDGYLLDNGVAEHQQPGESERVGDLQLRFDHAERPQPDRFIPELRSHDTLPGLVDHYRDGRRHRQRRGRHQLGHHHAGEPGADREQRRDGQFRAAEPDPGFWPAGQLDLAPAHHVRRNRGQSALDRVLCAVGDCFHLDHVGRFRGLCADPGYRCARNRWVPELRRPGAADDECSHAKHQDQRDGGVNTSRCPIKTAAR